MNLLNNKKSLSSRISFILLGFIGLYLVYLGNFNGLYRTLVIFIANLFLFFGLVYKKKINLRFFYDSTSQINKWSLAIAISLSISFVILLIIYPKTFSKISDEDNIIEWSSALLLFVASLLSLISGVKHIKKLNHKKYAGWLLLGLGLGLFVVAMEEVSWFQRDIGFATPKAFEGNSQNEFNIHNFDTNLSEIIYYNGAFIFLVFLPFFNKLFKPFSKFKEIDYLIPKPVIALAGVLACAYNFDTWDSIITESCFFWGLMILSIYAINSIEKNERRLILFIIGLLIIQQITFLNKGDYYMSPYVIKEYKEFFIPLGFFVFSLNIFSSIKNHN